jgi:single-strand DNA-binding protein
VTAWRHLAENIRDSVRKGDAVIVHGRLRTESWTREDGQSSSTLQIEASLVGHDLCRGKGTFLRTPKPERPDHEVGQEVDDMIRRDHEATPMDSWGNPREGTEGSEEAVPDQEVA